jgi:hypothetical protein
LPDLFQDLISGFPGGKLIPEAVGIFGNLFAVYRVGLMTYRVKGTFNFKRWVGSEPSG